MMQARNYMSQLSPKMIPLSNWSDNTVYQGRAAAFHELRRYHTRPLRLSWSPENVHFGKRQFLDLYFNAWILFIIGKLKMLPDATFFCLAFSQCEEKYVNMWTLCVGKLYKIKEIKESYTKCPRSAQAAKLVSLKINKNIEN